MIQAVTKNNLYLILPYKVSQLAVLYARNSGVSAAEAIKTIYRSNTYQQLEREETKLWHYGPVALMEYMKENH